MSMDCGVSQLARQKGVVLILLMAALLVVFTGVLVGQVSINAIKKRNIDTNSQSLVQAKQALLSYALNESQVGSMPCPDTDQPADGIENRVAGRCERLIGWLPYKTLGLKKLVDSSGTALWYSVEAFVSDTTNSSVINPSVSNNFTVNSIKSVAVVIAPGSALSGQTRNNIGLLNYLEGDNTISDLQFNQSIADNNNDHLLGIATIDFFNVIQQYVMRKAADAVQHYKAACGEFPWAADFQLANGNSVTNLQQGAFPFSNALPVAWDSGCASGISLPASFASNWQNQLFYGFCIVSQGDCLSVNGSSTIAVTAVIIAPGVPLTSQDRSTLNLSAYFEFDNSTGSSPYTFLRPVDHTSSYNDLSYVIR